MGDPTGLPAAVLREVTEAVPLLVERTRAQIELVGRLVGHLPCITGRSTPASGDADGEAPDRGAGSAPGADPGPDDHVVDGSAESESERGADHGAASEEAPSGDAPAVESLAIPDYDSLAASQVVPRLASLDSDELASVGRYERAHRSRQTILNRVRQLQSVERP